MINVLLAEDHRMVREALEYLLEAQRDIHVIATVADGLEAVEQTMELRPDITILNISMPHTDGIEAAKQIIHCCPRTRIVILTIFNTREHVRDPVRSGATGYVLKDAAAQELVKAVRALHRGEKYFSSRIADEVKDLI